jgi:hypothetical protein
LELAKGDYTVKLQLVHPSHEILEKAKVQPLSLDTKLSGDEKDVKVEIQRGEQISPYKEDQENLTMLLF